MKVPGTGLTTPSAVLAGGSVCAGPAACRAEVSAAPQKTIGYGGNMFKELTQIFTLALIFATTASRAQAPTNDSLTGIPVFPSAGGAEEPIQGGICRIKAQTVIYYVPFLWGPNHTASPKQVQVADVEQWYQAHLKDFRLISGSDGQRKQDVFLSPDGIRAITITGKPNGSGAFAISFTLFSGPAQPSQVKGFASHTKIQC
jgi:hypothetical protein